MTPDTLHPLAKDYLRRLRRAGHQLPPERLRELLAEIQIHLSEAIAPGASDHEALDVLERLGSPGDIIEAERPPGHGPTDRRSWREWGAVILLPLGGFAFGVRWLVGLVLLWSSRLWTTREKLIGTLIVPGGIATALLVLVLTGTKRRCRGVRDSRSVDRGAGRTCHHALHSQCRTEHGDDRLADRVTRVRCPRPTRLGYVSGPPRPRQVRLHRPSAWVRVSSVPGAAR
jgi:hypothetical protein